MGIRSIDEVRSLFERHGVRQVYVKRLAPKQDNEKNQIYLGSGLDGASNLSPATIVPRSASKSVAKPKSAKGRPKVEAQIDLAWLDRDGALHPAPHARIIDYFQYPEIRFSGFMRGCDEPPDALRRDRSEVPSDLQSCSPMLTRSRAPRSSRIPRHRPETHSRHNPAMNDSTTRLERMTVDELVAEYNRHGPMEPLERWDGDRTDLVAMVRMARKQSSPDGLVDGVSVSGPD